jgi:mono/diheme cytochrome c family protein
MSMPTKILLGVVIALGAGALVLGYSVMRRGFGARGEPSKLETFIARNIRDMAIPADAKAMQNPVAFTAERRPGAEHHWMEHCSSCHALDGSGDTPIGRNLYPPPPDMRESLTQDLSDGELFHIIANGVRFTGMPAWGDEDSEEDIWDLVSFIRVLPTLTPEELQRIERGGGPTPGAETSEAPAGHSHAPGTPSHTHAPATPAHTHAPGTPPHTH